MIVHAVLGTGLVCRRFRIARTATSTSAKYWGEAIGASVLANFVKLLGISVTWRAVRHRIENETGDKWQDSQVEITCRNVTWF
jgi:hypothetical protein